MYTPHVSFKSASPTTSIVHVATYLFSRLKTALLIQSDSAHLMGGQFEAHISSIHHQQRAWLDLGLVIEVSYYQRVGQ